MDHNVSLVEERTEGAMTKVSEELVRAIVPAVVDEIDRLKAEIERQRADYASNQQRLFHYEDAIIHYEAAIKRLRAEIKYLQGRLGEGYIP